MLIWQLDQTCNIESFVLDPCKVSAQSHGLSTEIKHYLLPASDETIGKAEAYLVTEGHALDACMLARLTKAQKPIYLCINNMASKMVSYLKRKLHGLQIVLLYVDTGDIDLNFIRHANWMLEQSLPICLCSNQLEQIQLFMLLKPYAVICDLKHREFTSLMDAMAEESEKPQDIDHIERNNQHNHILTVKQDLRIGDKISTQDLMVNKSNIKGISVYMVDHLDGVTLRYAIEKGEPLTFGHLYIETNPHAS